MHQHDKTNQIVLEIFKLITLKKSIPFKKVKRLFIQGDPLITKLFWDFLRSQQSEQYQEVSHCPGCDKFTLEKRVTFLGKFMKYFI